MDPASQHDPRRNPCHPVTGPYRLAFWKATQKKWHGKLALHEVAKRREGRERFLLHKRPKLRASSRVASGNKAPSGSFPSTWRASGKHSVMLTSHRCPLR